MSVFDSWSDSVVFGMAEVNMSALRDLEYDTLRINLAWMDEFGRRLKGFKHIVFMLGDRELSYTPDEVVAALNTAREAMS